VKSHGKERFLFTSFLKKYCSKNNKCLSIEKSWNSVKNICLQKKFFVLCQGCKIVPYKLDSAVGFHICVMWSIFSGDEVSASVPGDRIFRNGLRRFS
jgi:hypothetical protein